MASAQNQTLPQVDQTAVKAAQAITLILLLLGFVLDNPWLVAVAALCQLIGATGVRWAPFALVYSLLVRPLGILKPNVQPDHHAPHRFASLVGGVLDAAAAVLLFLGAPVAGWILAWIVIVLANLNVWAGFCMGCWMYYALSRLGLPGFRRRKIS